MQGNGNTQTRNLTYAYPPLRFSSSTIYINYRCSLPGLALSFMQTASKGRASKSKQRGCAFHVSRFPSFAPCVKRISGNRLPLPTRASPHINWNWNYLYWLLFSGFVYSGNGASLIYPEKVIIIHAQESRINHIL